MFCIIRYDYNAETKGLFVEFPSYIHRGTTEALAREFAEAWHTLDPERHLRERWSFARNREVWYEDDIKGGSFILDGMVRVDEEPFLYCEVALTRSWAVIRAKVGRILAHAEESVRGVLVARITESPKYSSPGQPPVADEFIERREFVRRAKDSQATRQLGSILMDGHR